MTLRRIDIPRPKEFGVWRFWKPNSLPGNDERADRIRYPGDLETVFSIYKRARPPVTDSWPFGYRHSSTFPRERDAKRQDPEKNDVHFLFRVVYATRYFLFLSRIFFAVRPPKLFSPVVLIVINYGINYWVGLWGRWVGVGGGGPPFRWGRRTLKMLFEFMRGTRLDWACLFKRDEHCLQHDIVKTDLYICI